MMNSIARLNKTAKALSVAGIILVAIPFIYVFTAVGGINGGEVVFSIVLPTVLVLAGYYLQALMGYITKFKRIEDSFDDKVKFVDLRVCILPIILAVVAFFPIFRIYRSFIMATDINFDSFSLSQFTVPMISVAAMICGIIMWFYPYGKLVHIEMVYGYGALFLIVAIITAVFEVPFYLLTVCFILFLGIFFTVSNLKSIEESISASKFRIPDNNFRKYNFSLITKHFLLTITVGAVVFSLLVVLLNSVPLPNFTFDTAEEEFEEHSYDNGETEERKGKLLDLFMNGGNTDEKTHPLVVLCGTVCTVFFVVLALRWLYKKHLLKKFFYLILMIFSGIKNLFYGLFDLFAGTPDRSDDVPQSYVDTEKDVECFIEYRNYSVKQELTPRTFDTILASKESIEEKYAYAYSVYATLIRGHRYGIKASDTPRMLTAKLKAARRNELDDATPVFEGIRYQLKPPKADICERELKELISHIKILL